MFCFWCYWLYANDYLSIYFFAGLLLNFYIITTTYYDRMIYHKTYNKKQNNSINIRFSHTEDLLIFPIIWFSDRCCECLWWIVNVCDVDCIFVCLRILVAKQRHYLNVFVTFRNQRDYPNETMFNVLGLLLFMYRGKSETF